MKRYFIYACEQTYGGYHGIENFTVEEFDDEVTEDEIYSNWVVEMSYELMEQYDTIELDWDDFDNEDEYYDIYADMKDENVDGYVVPIKENLLLSTNELNHLAVVLGPDLFKAKYCNLEVK